MGGNTFTFTQNGTLTVTASYDGCLPASASYTYTSGQVKPMNDEMDEEDESTDIETVRKEDPALNDVWYNLAGQRVDKPTKGIFVNGNGKKAIFR